MVQEKFSRSSRIDGFFIAGVAIWRDVTTDELSLSGQKSDIGSFEIDMFFADGFDFVSREEDAGFIRRKNLVIEEGFFIRCYWES